MSLIKSEPKAFCDSGCMWYLIIFKSIIVGLFNKGQYFQKKIFSHKMLTNVQVSES